MMDRFKVGNYLKHENKIIQVTDSREGKYLFKGRVIKANTDKYSIWNVNEISDTWNKDPKIWTLLKGYNTPLWKVINENNTTNTTINE